MSNPLVNRLVENALEEDRVVALENCLLRWDDVLDVETCVQGVADRYRAMGDKIEVIQLQRVNLNEVKMFDQDMRKLADIRRSRSATYWRNEDFFHENEIRTISDTILNNFHH